MKIKQCIFTLFLLCLSNFLTAGLAESEVCGDGQVGPGVKPRSPAMTARPSMDGANLCSSVIVTTCSEDGTKLQVAFKLKYRKVNVSIKDAYRCVHYQSTLSVPESNKVTIDITMLPAGKYTIEYVDENRSVVGSDKFTTR